MAILNVRPGGTKQATGSGDYASTPDDWSLANCYDTLHMIGFNSVSGSPADYMVAGDEVVMYSDIETPVVHELNFARMRDVAAVGAVTIRSKDGIAASCILSSSSASNTDLQFNNATETTDYVLQDLTFTKTVPHTGANAPLIYIHEETGDVSFIRCKFTGYRFDATTNSATLNSIVVNRLSNSVASTRNIAFTDCTWSDIAGSLNGTTAGGYKPCFYGEAGTQLVINGTTLIDGINLAWTQNNSGASNDGYFNVTGSSSSITINGVLTASNCKMRVTHTDAANAAVIFASAECPLTVNGEVRLNNIYHTGGAANAFGVHATGVFDIATIIATDCTVIHGTPTLGLGGTFLSQTAATGLVDYIEATRVKCNNGSLAENSGGGTMTINRFKAIDCQTESGVLYIGGDGDATIGAGLIKGSRHFGSASRDVVDIFCQTNETTVDRNCVRQFNQITIVDSDPGAGFNSVFVRHANTGATEYDQTTTFNNCIFAGGTSREFDTNEGSLTTLDLTLVNCAYANVADIDVSGMSGSGTFTNTNPIVSPNFGLLDSGRLAVTSPLVEAGVRWWTSTGARGTDVDGEALPDVGISVGAFQSLDGVTHPTQL